MSKILLETLISVVLCTTAGVLYFMVIDDNGDPVTNEDGTIQFVGSQRRPARQGRTPESASGDIERTILHDGLRRTYIVHVPRGHREDEPLPVLLAFHGGGGRATAMRIMSRLNEASDRFGFLVVYPNGTGRLNLLTYNAGTCCGYAARNRIDDVGFVRELLADLPKHYRVRADRVFATGISNGGMLCYRLACELSDKIAGIAPISGGLGVDGPPPSRPVPVIHFHGVQDRNVPFAGGIGERAIDRVSHRSIAETINFWVKANHCRPEPVEIKRERDYVVTRYEPAPGQAGAPVVLYALHEGGHTWPGGVDTTARFGTGKLIESVDADAIMWSFFDRIYRAGPGK